jgi:excisionase family DNA binding protein
MTIPALLSIEETSKLLRVSDRSVQRLIKAGKLKRVKIGHRVLVKESDIIEYLETASE